MSNETRTTNIRWIVLGFCLAASFIAYVLRLNVSVLGDAMRDDLGFDTVQLGMIAGAFMFGYSIFQFPGGVLGTRFGPRLVMTLSMILWGVFAAAMALVPGSGVLSVGAIVWTLVVLRVLLGAVQAPLYPCTAGAMISNWFPVGGWGLPNGLTSTGLTLGGAVTAPLLVWVLEASDWRAAILFTVPIVFLLAAVWWWYVRDFPVQHKDVSEAEQAFIDAGRPPPESIETKGSWLIALANRNILLLTISYFCMNYVFYMFFTWFFIYLVDVKEFPNQQASWFMSAQWILGAVGATAGGFLADIVARNYGFRLGPRYLCVPALLLCGIFLFVGATTSNIVLAVVSLCLSFAFTQLTEASYWNATISVSGRHAAEATGILNTGGNIVGAFGGVMVPLLATKFSWTIAMASGTIFAFIGAALWLFVRADEPMIESEAVVAAKPIHAG